MDNKEYLEKILPHKKPMILIDDIVKYSLEDNWLESIVTIREDSIFYDKNIEGVSSIVGIEYMAQTIGCYAFLRRKQEKPHIGFLLGTRLYNNSIEKFSLGKTYTIKVSEIFTDNSLFSFANQIDNGILVTSFYNDKYDTLLSNVQLYLDSIIKRSLDVRKDNRDNFMFEVYRKNLLK